VKLLMENWREYLNEAELKYPQGAWDEMFKITLNAIRNKKDESTQIDIKFNEIYYLENRKIKNGSVLSFLAATRNGIQGNLKKLTEAWNPEKKILEGQFIDDIFNKYGQPITFIIDKDLESMGTAGTAHAEALFIQITINPWKHKELDQIKDTLRHELQHVTQRLNGNALQYGEQLDKVNGDISKIKEVPLRVKKEFGIGKQKTGLRQISPERARRQGISDDERLKRYLGDDFEYETWMSDLLSDYTRWLVANKLITSVNLQFANFKDLYPNVLKEGNMEDRKAIINLAKQIGMKPIEAIKVYKTSPSFNQLAVKYVKVILTNDQILQKFSKDSGISYGKSIKTLLKLRSKEFAGDLVKNLELRLKKMGKTK